MKNIKTFEQYCEFSGFVEPDQWDLLKFLTDRNETCSLSEILFNFPNEIKTKEVLKSLSDQFFVDSQNGMFKITNDGAERIKQLRTL